jgi:threonine/homoserine efflux transporter RhtA
MTRKISENEKMWRRRVRWILTPIAVAIVGMVFLSEKQLLLLEQDPIGWCWFYFNEVCWLALYIVPGSAAVGAFLWSWGIFDPSPPNINTTVD